MNVLVVLLLSPFILLTSYVWIPLYLFEVRECNDRTLVSVTQLRRADALTCDVDLAGTVNGAPWNRTFRGRACGEFGACLKPLLLHALERGHERPEQRASSLAGGCGRMFVYHNHWDVGRCMQLVSGTGPKREWVAAWADMEADWRWLWQGLWFALSWVALLAAAGVWSCITQPRPATW